VAAFRDFFCELLLTKSPSLNPHPLRQAVPRRCCGNRNPVTTRNLFGSSRGPSRRSPRCLSFPKSPSRPLSCPLLHPYPSSTASLAVFLVLLLPQSVPILLPCFLGNSLNTKSSLNTDNRPPQDQSITFPDPATCLTLFPIAVWRVQAPKLLAYTPAHLLRSTILVLGLGLESSTTCMLGRRA